MITRVRPVSLAGVLGVLQLGTAIAAPQTHSDRIFMLGNPAGSQTVSSSQSNSYHAEYSFNDRGRGDHILAAWKLDAAGVPTEYSGHGNDYMKAPVSESFRLSGAVASWHTRSQGGQRTVHGEAFYLPAEAPPEFLGVLARALLKAPEHRLALLPVGEATLHAAGSLSVPSTRGSNIELQLYQVNGLDFGPTAIWLEADGRTAGVLSDWFSVIAPDFAPELAKLLAAQGAAAATHSQQLAADLTHLPHGDLLIRHARLFDPRDLRTTPGMSVLIRGERIVRVAPDADITAASDVEILDAAGRFLMPGLWDNHQHFGDSTGALDLAAGVTSSRDMANDTDEFPQRVARFDAGTELGPRVFKAGIIDGTGPLAGPTKMRVSSAAEALADVSWYADHGYGQIKIYSSMKPELVPLIADAAHARGLRVSGHVPAFMSARQFVAAGADEIQHLNFIVLNFYADTVKDTRGTARFTAVAEHVHELTPETPAFQEFVRYLKEHHTVLDPTLNIFEGMFCGDPSALLPGTEGIVERLPAQVRRSTLSSALTVPKGQEAAYREAFPAMLRLLKSLYDSHVTIIPGTDSLPGYMLQHELELYVRAGIPAPEVLRMATLTSAQVIGVSFERGVIAAGKLADLILIDGDPSTNISDIRNTSVVIRGGRMYDPAQIERALGIAAKQ